LSIIELRLKELGITLPAAPKPAASYLPAITIGDLVYTSGNDCRLDGKLMYEGKLGTDLTIEQGQQAARQTAINLLSVLKEHLGDLDRITQIVKVLGFVNSAPGFDQQPYVINGASDFFEQVFGEKGRHARSALGTSELPFKTPVEIEMIVKIGD
jgi:enamine deaminase RidA (YjgF/YER057c/UK114 family)